jgi:hypothetical protein
MTGKVRSLRVLKQTVVVGFPDGTEAEVPLDQLTWEGRSHIKTVEHGGHMTQDPQAPVEHGGHMTQDPQAPVEHGGRMAEDPQTPA